MFGKSLPTVVGYFVALLVTKILAGLPMVLLRSGKYSFLFQRIFPVKCWVFVLITSEFLVYTPKGALVRLIFLRTIFTKKFLSQREIDEVYRPQYLLYGWEVSYDYIFPTYFVVGNSFLKIKIYIIAAVSYAAISYCYLFYFSYNTPTIQHLLLGRHWTQSSCSSIFKGYVTRTWSSF